MSTLQWGRKSLFIRLFSLEERLAVTVFENVAAVLLLNVLGCRLTH